MTRKQSLRKLQQAAREKIGDLAVGPGEDVSPFMSDRLSELAAAARLITEGRYGTCLGCGGDIPLCRLRAKPEAVRCVRCQSEHERAPASAAAYHINPHMRSAS